MGEPGAGETLYCWAWPVARPGTLPDPHPPTALVFISGWSETPGRVGVGGLTPAQHSSDFHYVWQLLGLCVLEGPACVLAGVGRSAASLPPSFPPSVRPSVSLRNRGRGRAEPYPCPRVCLVSLSLFLPLPLSPLLFLTGPSTEIQAVAAV